MATACTPSISGRYCLLAMAGAGTAGCWTASGVAPKAQFQILCGRPWASAAPVASVMPMASES